MVYKALSGLPGNSGSLTASHDQSLVRVIEEHKKPRRKYAVVCPHAGKAFCWGDFLKSLKQLPIEKSHVVLYDNSRSADHLTRLKKLAKSLPSATLVQDQNAPSTIEVTMESDRLIDRCCYVYEEIYHNHLPESDFVINLEDDIGIPPGGFERLEWVLGDENVGTVIGACNDRRLVVSGGPVVPIVCNFHERRIIGGEYKTTVDVEMLPSRPGGVEWVGAGHMGLWLSRREAVDATGMKTDLQARQLGQDIQYGLRLNQSGWKFAVNWEVKLKHFYLDRESGRKVSV